MPTARTLALASLTAVALAACPGPRDFVESNPELAAVLGLISNGAFSHGDSHVFQPLVSNLTDHDHFLVLADYADYIRSQEQVSATWRDAPTWTRMSILNAARTGKFSSDRSIEDYARDIWHMKRVPITRTP